MIPKIVIENFKSYAGVQVLGPFHKSFSSIVGPNGSGKSNVIDAMLFVFGYRSKMIRSKKVSQLIHSSEKHLNVENCTVSVYFQKIIDLAGDDYEVVPGSGFCVSRTARKDNSSDYSINGRKAPFKEVAQLLKSNGVDLDHNRFLILQGEVEQISMMKPKALTEHEEGMLEYLEDIVGSSVYKEPIENIAKEVEQLNEQRGEKLNRVKAVEKEKDELESAKNEAVEYIGVENEMTKKRNALYQKYIHECVKNERQAEEKRNEIKTHFDELQTQLKDLSERKNTKGKEHKKLEKKYEKLKEIAEETKKNFAVYDRDDLKLREDLKHCKQNSKKLSKSLEKEKEKLTELQGAPDKNKTEVENLEKKREDFEAQKVVEDGKLAEVMAGLKHETQGIQNEKEAKEAELMELNKAVNETKSQLDVAKSELEIYTSQQEGVLSQRNTAISNLEKAVKKAKERESELKTLEKDLPETRKNLQKAERELEKANEGERKASEELRSTLRKVEEARSSLQAARSRGKVLESLMQQKESGNIPGIFGRLGDLGAIDDKYDVAISTACGALDNIVCDTIDTAQKCVEFLKQNNIGVATFIGLDKVENLRKEATSKIQTPQNVPRLFDLVRVKNEKIRTAFFFALRNTLVADDLDQATKIAYQGSKRWRVVTLQGQLIDQSGTMSGGGTRVVKGRMSASFVSDISPQQLSQMEKKLETNTKAKEEFQESKGQLEELVVTLKRQLSSMEHQLDKNNMEIQALTQQQKDLKEQIKHLDEQVKQTAPDETRLKELQKTVTQNEKQYRKAADVAAKVEAEVQRLHKNIMDISGSKLKLQQNKVDIVNKMIDEVNAKITKANVAIKSSHRNIKKSEDKVASIEKEIEENNEAIKKLEKDFETLDVKATQVLEDLKNAKDQMQEMEATLGTVGKEFTALGEEENEIKTKEVDIKHEVEKYEVVLKENQQKVRYWKKELSKLSLQSVGLADDTPQQLETLNEEQVEIINKEDIQYDITVLEEKLNSMKPDMAAIAEYRKKEEIYLCRVKELDKVTNERDTKRHEHEALRKKRLEEFMAGFTIITTKLKEMYQMITLGGDAELELVDSLDPFSEGIVFSVRPPKKSWKNIANLSGGEKTLSSLALVFALHHYKPTPFYVMDEIDAALDFRNVSIVANYIKDRTKNAQFIIISLRNNMFELADHLIGIFKTYNCTKNVVINPKQLSCGQA